MAWTLVGSSTHSIIVGAGNQTFTLPGTPAEDDIVIISVATNGFLDFSDYGDITTTGYTLIQQVVPSPDIEFYYKIMGATPDTSVDINDSGTDHITILIQVWRGVDTASPIDAEAAAEDTGSFNDGTPNPPSITTNTNGALVFVGAVSRSSSTTTSITAPSGYSNLSWKDESDASDTPAASAMASKEVATAGAEDPGVFPTWDGPFGSDSWAAYTYALKPAATGQTITVGIVSETDSALSIAINKTRSIGIVAETGSALSLSAQRIHSLGIVSEADSALPLNTSQVVVLGIPSETDSALAITIPKVRLLGIATSTESALAVGRLKTQTVGLVSTSASALSVGRLKEKAVGIPSTSTSALSVTRLKTQAVGLVSATNTTLGVTAVRAYAVGIVSETGTAFAVTAKKLKSVGIPREVDGAHPLVDNTPELTGSTYHVSIRRRRR